MYQLVHEVVDQIYHLDHFDLHHVLLHHIHLFPSFSVYHRVHYHPIEFCLCLLHLPCLTMTLNLECLLPHPLDYQNCHKSLGPFVSLFLHSLVAIRQTRWLGLVLANLWLLFLCFLAS